MPGRDVHPADLTVSGRLPSPNALRVAIFGAMPDTGNMGVTALFLSLLQGIARRDEDAVITVFDDRPGSAWMSVGESPRKLYFRRCGATPTRRLYRRDSLWWIRSAGRLGRLGALTCDALAIINETSFAIDITGGDSFTDLYGRRRFAWATAIKRIVLSQDRPLILAPQTLGPFVTPSARREAAEILRAATAVWTRDDNSLETMSDLLDGDVDPHRHRRGVDVAFALEPLAPSKLTGPIGRWITGRDTPIVGINVSGLLWNDVRDAAERFSLRADYIAGMTRFVRRLLGESDTRVVLVPHVITGPGNHENDVDACHALRGRMPRDLADRIDVLEGVRDPRHAKWLVGQLDWFCGARMHACIAALSSGVPASGIAYSPKTSGTFETFDQGDHVADARHLDTAELVDRLLESWQSRDATRARLKRVVPDVLARAGEQMDEMIAAGRAASETARRGKAA